jgi:hypothetical protein
VSFFDADDVSVVGSLSKRVRFLEERSDAGAVFGTIDGLIDANDKFFVDPHFHSWIQAAYYRDRSVSSPLTPDRIVNGDLAGYSSIVYRKECLDSVGEFDETLPQAEDFDLAYRFASKHSIWFLDTPCVYYRIHGSNSSVEMQSGRVVARPETGLSHHRALAKHGLR